ncbi:MAG: HAD family hydrolase [Halioglobus sp.]
MPDAQHVMFDVDGTLTQSYALDSQCYIRAVESVTGIKISDDWARYQHVTDAGILNETMAEHGGDCSPQVHEQVKAAFLANLNAEVAKTSVQAVPGAPAFLDYLYSQPNVSVSFATGGWRESAFLKLESAGVPFQREAFASSDDHYSRTEIMKIAARRAGLAPGMRCTYFGDGLWDAQASRALGYAFVRVGGTKNTLQPHEVHINDYEPLSAASACL